MNNFSTNLKYYRKLNNLSQKELGLQLDLGQTTIANYESGTRTPTLEILIKLSSLLSVSIDQLLVTDPLEKQVDINLDMQEQIKSALLNKDEYQAFMLFRQLNPNKSNLSVIFEKIITPIMVDIGILWDTGVISISDEHYITNLMSRIIDMLSIHGIDTPKNGKKAVCMTVSNEPHTLGIKMISIYLELLGFQSIYIGNNLPSRHVIQLLNTEKPDIFLISVTMPYHLNSVNDLIRIIQENISSDDLHILVGGQGIHSQKDLDPSDTPLIKHYIKSLSDLSLWLNQQGFL